MVIGVKYCGGCNPGFERGDITKKLIKKYTKHTFVNVNADVNKLYDLVIVICGCSTKCANYQSLLSKNGFIVIGTIPEVAIIEEKIQELEAKGL